MRKWRTLATVLFAGLGLLGPQIASAQYTDPDRIRFAFQNCYSNKWAIKGYASYQDCYYDYYYSYPVDPNAVE